MEAFANQVVDSLNGLLWGKILIWLLVGCGIWFTLRLGFIQVRHLGHTFTVLRGSRQSDASGISSFQALCTSLAARVGTGNIAGVAVAITLGGPGAIFWMWVIALVGMATGFVEATLAQLFKQRDDKGQFRGGPAYYMEKGLGQRWAGTMFSIFLIIAFGFAFNSVQSNTIASAMVGAFELDMGTMNLAGNEVGVAALVIGVVVTILTAVIIFGGLRSIARFSELAVPFMAVGYLVVAVGIILANLGEVPGVLAMIVKSAFGFHEAAAGGIGAAILNGFKRGLFSNEAGMGSAPNAAAAATPYPPHPASQGYVQMAGVFIDTMLICTASAAIILLAVFGATDWVDGYLARRLKQRTALGAKLDPIADRLYILATVIVLLLRGIVPIWFVVALLARDVMLALLVPVLRKHGIVALPVNYVGKAGTFLLLFALPLILIGSETFLGWPAAYWLGWTLGVAGAVFYWAAGLLYVRETVRLAKAAR